MAAPRKSPARVPASKSASKSASKPVFESVSTAHDDLVDAPVDAPAGAPEATPALAVEAVLEQLGDFTEQLLHFPLLLLSLGLVFVLLLDMLAPRQTYEHAPLRQLHEINTSSSS